jgi:hypothetical protein
MRSAEQITEVAQSEYVWDLYVRSGILRSGASDPDALNEARSTLETKSVAFANCHLERERVIKALERINVLSSSGIDDLQSVKKLAQNEASGFRNEPLFFASDEKQTHALFEQRGSPGTAQL